MTVTSRFMWPALIVLALLAAATSGVVVLHAQGPSGQQAAALALRGTDVFPVGLHRVPPFALRDQNGRMLSPVALRGRVFAITFLDSVCVKECPVAGRELASVQRLLGPNSPLTVVVVSVDPAADTPVTARAFVRHSGLTGRWHWLLGTRRQLLPVWIRYGIEVRPVTGDISHTAAVYLIDREGWMRVADGVPFIPSQLAGSVRALATRAGHQ